MSRPPLNVLLIGAAAVALALGGATLVSAQPGEPVSEAKIPPAERSPEEPPPSPEVLSGAKLRPTPPTEAADAAVDGAGVTGVGQEIRDRRGRLRVGLGRRGIGERPPAHGAA